MNVKDLAKKNAIWLIFIAEILIFTVVNPVFITPSNLVAIARQVAVYGIASVGMTFVILIAGIDLSAGTIITLVNVVCAYCIINMGVNLWVATIIALCVAVVIGILNGFMVATIGIPAIIATFASQTIFEGLAYIISGGMPIALERNTAFDLFGRWSVGIVPVSAIIMIICFVVGAFILTRTYFGRYFYAIGGNEEAAELSGIRVNRMKYLIYSLSAFFAGLAGIVTLSRTGSAQNTAGKGLEFDFITCVVLGGVSVNGGVGSMSGVIAGVLIIGALKNGMILMNVNQYVQMIVKGVVLAVAVGLDCMSKKRQTM
ncbi:MAG: ABC transporter permease [Eubacteriales bacterium]|nr:ABC transporter permease [Eubacteriales bacterium]